MMNLSAAFWILVVQVRNIDLNMPGAENYDRALKVFGNVILLNLLWGSVYGGTPDIS